MMSIRSLFALAAALAMAASSADAHTYLSSINNNMQAVRQLPRERNYPIWDLRSNDMICGKDTQAQARQIAAVTAGSDITLQYYHNTESDQDDIIDRSHRGPCMVYMAKHVADLSQARWFKVFQRGFENGKYCVEQLIDDRGKLQFRIPAELENGRYIIRGEITALHEAETLWVPGGPRGAQYYAHCADVTVSGGQGRAPSADSLVSIPGHMTAQENVFNAYNRPGSAYVVRGPRIVTFATAAGPAPAPAPTPAPTPAPAAPAPSTQPTPGGGGNSNGAAPTVSWTRAWDNGFSGYGVRMAVRSSKPFSKMTVSYTLASSHVISNSWRMDRTGNSGTVTFTTPSWFSATTTFDFGMNVNYNGGRPTAPTAITVTVDGETFTVAPALSALSAGEVSTAPFGEYASSAPMMQRPGILLATVIATALVAGLCPSF